MKTAIGTQIRAPGLWSLPIPRPGFTPAWAPAIVTVMLRLTHAPNMAIATLWSDLLCEAGMPASVQRQYLSSVAGELPPSECLPEIWLRYAEHEERARALLHELQHLPQRHWRCQRCGEQIEGGFEQCWNCGALMPR